MRRRIAVADIEGDHFDPLLVTKVHCMWVEDYHSGERWDFKAEDMEDGMELLRTFKAVAFHNGIEYDIPVLERIYGGKLPICYDTLLASRLFFSDRMEHPAGGSSLKLWGEYLAGRGEVEIGKLDFDGPWDQWTEEMHTYCGQDVTVGVAILRHLMPRIKKYSDAFVRETKSAYIIQQQRNNGVGFDEAKAETLQQTLMTDRASVLDELHKAFPPRREELKTPQWWAVPNPERPGKGIKREKKTDAVKDAAKKYGITQKEAREQVKAGPLKFKEHLFNPGSALQIAERLREKYDWRPKKLTPSGQPQMDESVLSSLEFPEAELMQKYMLLQKRLSQISSWFEHLRDGKIHGSVNTIGCVSRRCSHSKPNLGQVPAVRSPYGEECRELFIPTIDGNVMVGADLSGLELRMLAHRMHKYDGGAYAKVLLEDDIHTANQHAGELLTRDQSKTSFYAYLYGAGDAKIGSSIRDHESLTPEQRKQYRKDSATAVGQRYREAMQRNLEALGKLAKKLQWMANTKGYIVTLDDARIPVRSPHMVLNTQLQTDGAVVAKESMNMLHQMIDNSDWKRQPMQLLHVHDEWQFECAPEDAEKLGTMMVDAMKLAGENLNVKLPIDGEYKIGKNWKETH